MMSSSIFLLPQEVSFDIFSEDVMKVDLEGEQMLHLADCLKGLNSAISRSDIPPNPYQYGTVTKGAKNIISVALPEILVWVHLASQTVQGDNGLGLKLSGINAGFIMGPEDYRFTTQVALGQLTVIFPPALQSV